MSGTARVIVVLVALLMVVGMSAFAQQKDPVPAYLLSILLGFGTGHFYLEDNMAVPFLLMDAGALALTVAGAAVAVVSAASFVSDPFLTSSPTGVYVGYGLMVVGSLAYSAFRIWEIVDIFGAANEQRQRQIALLPAATLNPDGQMGVGMSFRLSY